MGDQSPRRNFTMRRRILGLGWLICLPLCQVLKWTCWMGCRLLLEAMMVLRPMMCCINTKLIGMSGWLIRTLNCGWDEAVRQFFKFLKRCLNTANFYQDELINTKTPTLL